MANKVSRPDRTWGDAWRLYALELETRAKALTDAVAEYEADATGECLDYLYDNVLVAAKALRELMEGK